MSFDALRTAAQLHALLHDECADIYIGIRSISIDSHSVREIVAFVFGFSKR